MDHVTYLRVITYIPYFIWRDSSWFDISRENTVYSLSDSISLLQTINLWCNVGRFTCCYIISISITLSAEERSMIHDGSTWVFPLSVCWARFPAWCTVTWGSHNNSHKNDLSLLSCVTSHSLARYLLLDSSASSGAKSKG